jgi:glutamate mutase epsilon subunit
MAKSYNKKSYNNKSYNKTLWKMKKGVKNCKRGYALYGMISLAIAGVALFQDYNPHYTSDNLMRDVSSAGNSAYSMVSESAR